MMKNIKLSAKLFVGFFIITFFSIIIFCISIFSTITVKDNYSYILQKSVEQQTYIAGMQLQFTMMRYRAANFAMEVEYPDIINNTLIPQSKEAYSSFLGNLNAYTESLNGDHRLDSETLQKNRDNATSLRRLTDDFRKVSDNVLSFALAGNGDSATVTLRNAISLAGEINTVLNDMFQTSTERVHNNTERVSDTANTLLIMQILVALLCIILSVILTFYISNLIKRPLTDSAEILNQISRNFIDISEKLGTSATSLAKTGLEHAAAIQETSATMNQTSSMIKQTTDSTFQAKELAKNTGITVGEAIQQIEELMKGMNKLSESSQEISAIVSNISNISSQTNILALNASVEAVRAGEFGKSFSVVAEEMRSLAQKSSYLLTDTEDIVKNNQSHTNQNVETSNTANKVLLAVGEDSQKVIQLLNEISQAAEKQTRGVEQISTALTQMEKSTQVNAAFAEESSVLANELKNKTENLLQICQNIRALIFGVKS